MLVTALMGAAQTGHAVAQSSVPVVAVDAETGGNGARTVGSIEECVSAEVGEPVDIDIVLPAPGVPADRGVAAYQFDLLYDPEVVWVQADEADMLLAQAPGSSVLPIADPKPDANGLYLSWGVDFGPSGIEPAGSSEAGAGVIARLTLMPQGVGNSALTLSNVLIIDDQAERIDLGDVRRGAIYVGQACPGEDGPDPVPQEADLSPTPSPEDPVASDSEDGGTDGTDPGPQAEPAGGAGSVDAVPTAGGAPPTVAASARAEIAAGTAITLAGAAIVAAVQLNRRRKPRASSFWTRGQ